MSERVITVDKKDFVLVFKETYTEAIKPEENNDGFGGFLGMLVVKRLKQIAESSDEMRKFLGDISKELLDDFDAWKKKQADKKYDPPDEAFETQSIGGYQLAREDDDLQHTEDEA